MEKLSGVFCRIFFSLSKMEYFYLRLSLSKIGNKVFLGYFSPNNPLNKDLFKLGFKFSINIFISLNSLFKLPSNKYRISYWISLEMLFWIQL